MAIARPRTGTQLAQVHRVRPWLVAVIVLATASAPSGARGEPAPPPPRAPELPPGGTVGTSPDPLWQAEVHLGYGLAMSGSGTAMSKRATPLTLSALVDFAFNEEPRLFGYGGLVAELLDRAAIGGAFGVKYTPHGSRLHLAGGGVLLVAPDSLLGATASGGMCRRQRATLGLCGDVQVTAYFAGGDLAPGRAVTQIQLVLGAVLDVL